MILKVIINNIEIDWKSSFLDLRTDPHQIKWKKKRKDYFSFDTVNGVKLFIKRITEDIPETSFIKKIQHQHLINLPFIHDIVTEIENNQTVYYIFQEFIEGELLEKTATNKSSISIDTIYQSIIRSIKSIHEREYWHTDINAENILVKQNNQCYVIDLDSCENFRIKPTYISNEPGGLTTRSNQLASYVIKYFKTFLNKSEEFTFSSLHGKSLNLLQILFLVQQVKYLQSRSEKIKSWKKSTFKNVDLITDLRSLDPFLIDDLFLSAINNSIEVEKLLQVCNLIEKKLYNQKTNQLAQNESKLIRKKVEVEKPPSSTSEKDENKSSNNKTIIAFFVSGLLIIFSGYWVMKTNSKSNEIEPYEESSTNEQRLSKFFSLLNEKSNNSAFDLTSNPKWGPLKTFNSTSGWGGFENIELIETTQSDNKLLAYYNADNIQAGTKIHRLNGFEFDENGKINRMTYFPRGVRNSLTENAALNTVHQFFEYIINKQYKKAHYFTSNPLWGDVNYFSSSKTGWGGLSMFEVNEIRLENSQCLKGHELVFVKYYEEDPVNNNYGTREMYYHLDLKNQEFKIVRATLSKDGDSK